MNTNINDNKKGFQSSDPGFLVAKGRFTSNLDNKRKQMSVERDNLLINGKQGDDAEVVNLTKQMSDIDVLIKNDIDNLEKQHVKHLASAIFMAMSNHGYVNVRCVGNKATYNAVKSIAIASGYCKPKGIDLCFDVCFDEGNIGALRQTGHTSSVTAILFKLKDFDKWKDTNNVL